MPQTNNRKTQQYGMFALAAVSIGAVGFVVFGVLAPKTQTENPFGNAASQVDISVISDRTSAAAPEMSWVTDSKIQIDRMSDLVESLQETLEQDRATYATDLATVRDEFDEIILQQAQQIAGLEATISTQQTSSQNPAVQPASAVPGWLPDFSDTGSEFINRNGSTGPVEPLTRRVLPTPADQAAPTETDVAPARPSSFGQTFTLSSVGDPETGSVTTNTLRNYVPAGSYAPAVVLSGADAATNVVDRENPIPVLFRITGPAVTAARGSTGARINITGCTVQGSAIGDLSAERVKVRLLSMTCLKRNGSVIESNISGYMVGNGKAGVRGTVVSREGNLVTNAAIAGVLEGLASTAQAATQPTADSLAEIAQGALASAGTGGIEQAASTLSDYYISRAEQYQPVISLHGGTNVELVFLEGVSLK